MGKGNSWKVNETKGFQYLGHSNWTVCHLISWFCPKTFPPFYPASHNKPLLITPKRGRRENGKVNSWKVNETLGFQYLGHSNWTIFSLLSWFCPKNVPLFYPASHNEPFLITPERGRKENGKREFLKSQWVVAVPGVFKVDDLQSFLYNLSAPC